MSVTQFIIRYVIVSQAFLKFFEKSGFMCISPVRIRNPNYGNKSKYIALLNDTSSMYLNVPCGHCSECIAIRQMNVVQRTQMEEFNNHLFFCTLTYNNESLPSIETSNGYNIKYADIADVQKMMKRIRKHDLFGRKFKYFGVSELGKEKGRPHFHILLAIEKYTNDNWMDIQNLEYLMFNVVLSEWRRNYGSNRVPIWKPLCTFKRKMIRGKLYTNYDLHYVNPKSGNGDTSDVPFYVSKYMMKSSDRANKLQQALHLNLEEEEYNKIWNLVKPRSFSSLYWGSPKNENVSRYIQNCIKRSKESEDKPKFYNPFNGQSFPLSRYYMKFGNLYSIDDAIYFHSINNVPDNVTIDDRHISEKLLKIEKFKKNVKMVDSHDESYVFNEFD